MVQCRIHHWWHIKELKMAYDSLTSQSLTLVGFDEVPLGDGPTSPEMSSHEFIERTVERVLDKLLRIFKLKKVGDWDLIRLTS